MKKSAILSLLFAFVLLLSLPLEKADAAKTFKDVSNNSPNARIVYEAVEAGIISGYPDGTFRPSNNVTRAQAAIMLTNALGLDKTKESSIDYKDVKKGSFAYEEIAAVTNASIMKGSNKNFNPNQPLTRGQMAIILTNAFDLEGNNKVSFKDVAKTNDIYYAIDALYTNKITKGYEDNTFRPATNTSRMHFVLFLHHALNDPTDTSMADYLKEVYANEASLASYEFEGNMNFGVVLPEIAEEDAELGAIFSIFEDIDVSMTGAYQLDPMLFKANVAVTLKGDLNVTLNMPIIMTEDKMWMKFPDTPFLPVPEEIAGKYIEFDMAELSELSGQPVPTVNMDLQTEFAIAIQDLFFDHFAKDFYKEVSKAEVGFENNNDVEKVVKFELSERTLASFIDVLFNNFMPDFIELLSTPGYAEALGLTAEDLALMQEDLPELVGVNIEEMVSEINNFIKINDLTQYDVIHKDKYILSTIANIDVEMIDGEEPFGFKLSFDLNKSNVNKPVQIAIPDESQVVPFSELLKLEEEYYYDEELELDI